MSPSSPVSVGIPLSNRIVEVGSLLEHVVLLLSLTQFPIAEDPFTVTFGPAENNRLDGVIMVSMKVVIMEFNHKL